MKMCRGNRERCGFSGRGLSLIELLVSLVLGIILSGGIVSTYMSAKRNALYEEQMARMQESGRYAMRLLSRELKMAGFFGGIPSTDELSPRLVGADCSDQGWALDGGSSLDLVNNFSGQFESVSLNATVFTCLNSATIQPNTDLLAIKRTAGEASLMRGVPADGLTLSTGEIWYLRVVSESSHEWIKMRPLDLLDVAGFEPSSGYWEAISRILYIRRYSDSSDQSDDIPTLCMETLAGNEMTSRCLIEGVEDLQLEFGIDTDADDVPNQYKSAPTADDMQRIVTAKVHLLLRSISTVPGYQNTTTYALGEKILEPRRDAYLRRVLSSTVLLRNQIEPTVL